MTEVTLRVITEDDVRAVVDLEVPQEQTQFVAPNAISMAQASVASLVWQRAIYAGSEPVGYVLLSDDHVQPRYYVWRFMIDRRFQGRGFGTNAMEQVCEYVRSRPSGDRLFVSYVPGADGPQSFYEGLGFVATGRIHEGEHEAVLELRASSESGIRSPDSDSERSGP